jgi:UrcA family protein
MPEGILVRSADMIFKQFVSLAASIVAVAGGGFSGAQAVADGRTLTVAIPVRTEGLDLGQAADARKLYLKLKYAAHVACTNGYKVGLAPVPDLPRCVDMSLGSAVRSVNAPLLTQLYLETHTLQQANAVGLKVPAQVAGR